MDPLIQHIQNEAKKLDYSWFEQKRSSFESEPFYCAKTGNIIGSVWDEEEREKANIVSLNEYCWCAYFPHSNSVHVEQPAIDAKVVVDGIVQLLEAELAAYSEVRAEHKLIQYCRDAFSTTLSENQETCPTDNSYAEVINFVTEKWGRLLFKKFKVVKHQVSLLDVSEKLDFNIPKEQIAALLYLLNKAGIFKTSSEYDTRPAQFGEKYFQFRKNVNNPVYVECKGLEKKYRDVLNEQGSSIDKVKAMIKKVL